MHCLVGVDDHLLEIDVQVPPLRSFLMKEFESRPFALTTMTTPFLCFCILHEPQVIGSDESGLLPPVKCD